jgi:hypothetical protein
MPEEAVMSNLMLEPGTRVAYSHPAELGTIVANDARSIVGDHPLYTVRMDDGRTFGYVPQRHLAIPQGGDEPLS